MILELKTTEKAVHHTLYCFQFNNKVQLNLSSCSGCAVLAKVSLYESLLTPRGKYLSLWRSLADAGEQGANRDTTGCRVAPGARGRGHLTRVMFRPKLI